MARNHFLNDTNGKALCQLSFTSPFLQVNYAGISLSPRGASFLNCFLVSSNHSSEVSNCSSLETLSDHHNLLLPIEILETTPLLAPIPSNGFDKTAKWISFQFELRICTSLRFVPPRRQSLIRRTPISLLSSFWDHLHEASSFDQNFRHVILNVFEVTLTGKPYMNSSLTVSFYSQNMQVCRHFQESHPFLTVFQFLQIIYQEN